MAQKLTSDLGNLEQRSRFTFLTTSIHLMSRAQLNAKNQSINVPSKFFRAARACYCSEQKFFAQADDCAAH
jgi:hypothetical protein